MKKLFVVIAGLMLSVSAQAQSKEDLKAGSDSLRLLVGSAQQTMGAGLEYERRTGAFGVGARYMFGGENTDVNRVQTNTLGVQITSHLYDQSDLDVYVSAGLAATMWTKVARSTTPASTEDYTTGGPTLGLGFIYTLTDRWGVGLDYYSMYNWTNEEVGAKSEFSSAVLSYSF